jgi:carbamoyl-phosphate synthase large subunit
VSPNTRPQGRGYTVTRSRANVLVTAASRRVALVQAFQRALLDRPHGGTVVVTDVNPLSPAVYAADRAYRVPLSSDPGYIDSILEIAVGDHVGLVIPTIDDELALFGEARDRFTAHGIHVAVSAARTSELCADKYQTCRFLASNGVPAAESWLPHEVPGDVTFPLFVKPRRGRGGVGAHQVRDRRELDFFAGYIENPVVQRYLSGPEFTIDVLCDFVGRPLSIVPRRRDVIRAGVIDRGRTVNDPSLIALAAACVTEIPFVGAINIQCRMLGEQAAVFEINPRFSGGIPLTIAAGADFPRLLLDLADGVALTPSIGTFRDGLWMTSYESSMFLHDAQVCLPAYDTRVAPGEVA